MISRRLFTIANLVDKNKVVYDVGSDHGLLPCFLVENGICTKAYAVDNKEGPLKKARDNVIRYGLQDKVICKLSDGIEDIEEDVDIITIAGMGFYTIREILDGKKLEKYDRIIVQSNKNVPDLRRWISDNGYRITDERVVFDVHYYEIIVFEAKNGQKLTEEEIEYGPVNLKNMNSDFISYVRYQLDKYKKIHAKSHDPALVDKIKGLNDIIDKIVEE